ncbi:MAG: hypothetical protein M1823_001024 [Watsoniomyces obsoletus]|nr:MAG: hypothetical protein M1823_001024 [Watsoniomyces obsoletus]
MSSLGVDAIDRTDLDSTPRASVVPEQTLETPEETTMDPMNPEVGAATSSNTDRTGRRRMLGLAKKRDETDVTTSTERIGARSVGSASPARAMSPTSHPVHAGRPVSSYQLYSHGYQRPVSPFRYGHSPSPGLPSPSSSFIFERDVQDDAISPPSSSAIPSHITREDHIPPVLEASSLAITDEHLDPDQVTIVMHANHHPVAASASGPSSVEASLGALPDEVLPEGEAMASSYGGLDAHDVRRLSFVSFADVVQAEHLEHMEHMSGKENSLSTGFPLPASARSPSPVYSRSSSQGLSASPPGMSASPPTSGHASVGGLEGFTSARSPGSPMSVPSSLPAGELTVETMRQALRKTGSADLGGVRSQPLSANVEEFGQDVPWR